MSFLIKELWLLILWFPYIISEDVIHVKNLPIRGALVDEYNSQILLIKLKTPSDVIKDSLGSLDTKKIDPKSLDNLRRVFGSIEVHYSKQFSDLLAFYSELIVTSYPINYEKKEGNGQLIDISSLRRQKRQILQTIMSILRFVRPVARVSGKLTKYGRFLKAVKYTGYVVTSSMVGLEIAQIFGVMPDQKYDELSRQFNELHERRTEDLVMMRNISLLALNTNKNILDLNTEINNALFSSKDMNELSILISQIFSSYVQQTSTGIMLLLQGKLPSFMVPIETQKRWLEVKLPGALINEISSVTPHLELELKGIDSEKNQLIVLIKVPKPTSSFQLLNFVEWEPEVIINGTCFTPPKRAMFLAYPPSDDHIVRHPLLIDPESCLTKGYILCESDAILDHIPDLSLNRLCTKLKSMKANRNRREVEDLFESAQNPSYDITRLIEKTLEPTRHFKESSNEMRRILDQIDNLIISSKKREEESRSLLEQAKRDDALIKAICIFIAPLILYILYLLIRIAKSAFERKKQQEEQRAKEQLILAIRASKESTNNS